MTDSEQYAADRLENAIQEARLDELRKPDPCGTGMTIVSQAIENTSAKKPLLWTRMPASSARRTIRSSRL